MMQVAGRGREIGTDGEEKRLNKKAPGKSQGLDCVPGGAQLNFCF